MKSLVLHAIGDLRYEDVPMPQRQKGEVLLKVKACGICGSDIPRVFSKGTYHFPTIPGHEFSGEILEADNTELVGKHTAVFPLLPCNRCSSCQTGDYAQCKDYDYYGSRRDGAFAEYLAVKEWNLVYCDPKTSFEEAAMCEPAAVALSATNKAGIKVGDTVVIFGAGPIGVMVAMWARINGAFQVVLCDIDQSKISFAKELGFEHAINSKEINPVEYIQSITEGRGADSCLECVGLDSTWQQCLEAVKTFGTVVCVGNPSRSMTLTQGGYWEVLRKELLVKGTWNSSYNEQYNDWRTAMKAIDLGIIDLKPLITHQFSLAEFEKAFSIMRENLEFHNKVMFVNP